MPTTLLETTAAPDTRAPADDAEVTGRPSASPGPSRPWVAVRVGCCPLCPEAASAAPPSGRSPAGPLRAAVSR